MKTKWIVANGTHELHSLLDQDEIEMSVVVTDPNQAYNPSARRAPRRCCFGRQECALMRA
jgi:hypothetical protein